MSLIRLKCISVYCIFIANETILIVSYHIDILVENTEVWTPMYKTFPLLILF